MSRGMMVTKDEMSEYLRKLGRKGGKATAKKLTPEQRKEAARKAARARWAKKNKAR
jgi:general stress protein YciG